MDENELIASAFMCLKVVNQTNSYEIYGNILLFKSLMARLLYKLKITWPKLVKHTGCFVLDVDAK